MDAQPKVKALSSSGAASVPKKKYKRPKLEIYGSVSKITGAKPGRKNDGFGRPRTRA